MVEVTRTEAGARTLRVSLTGAGPSMAQSMTLTGIRRSNAKIVVELLAVTYLRTATKRFIDPPEIAKRILASSAFSRSQGHGEKNSRRAYVFRNVPNSGRSATHAALTFSTTSGSHVIRSIRWNVSRMRRLFGMPPSITLERMPFALHQRRYVTL
jgi:hypothetical protein